MTRRDNHILILIDAQTSSSLSRYRLWRDIGERPLLAERSPDAIRIVGLVSEHDGSSSHMVKQSVSRLPVVPLSSGQAQSDREALPVDNRVDFGREPASGATETMISIPLFAVAAC
ncbi:hypothetical protein GCM10011494_38860 [Novosphingobium endophyticum]|uniref:Uncharacterized protein n=1 Tax=Novosphingobium endophyticum TaxID=1955250 RepID=A0A916TVN9_9SPHN|nr:hypothetical protein GCM10011494_38860 [Novosphingobium endophyticum]